MKLLSPMFLVFAVALIVLAISMFFPVAVGLYFDTGNTTDFLNSAMICLISATLFWIIGNRNKTTTLVTRQMFLITGGTWFVMPLFASLPFLLNSTGISFTDATFETVSGITTTGSTVFTNLNRMPQDILLWRSILQWLGGIGIICMAVAILPFLKVGGMRLFQTESSHWSDDNAPRAQLLVKSIIFVYIVLTLICAGTYVIDGMQWLDAVNHAMTTMSTGGFSTLDESFINRSMFTQWTSIVFMLSASIPFVLYAYLLSGKHELAIRNGQLWGLMFIVTVITFAMTAARYANGEEDLFYLLTTSAFNVTSVITTTGFASADYTQWGSFCISLFFFATFIGGCSGSTSGGIKIFRFQLYLILFREHLRRAVHPRLSSTIKYNNQIIGDGVITALSAYTFILICCLVVITLGLALTGLDLVTSLTAAATAMMNVGPGLGDVIGPVGNFSSLSDPAKWLLSAGMILGRLEFLTILILLTPSYWRG